MKRGLFLKYVVLFVGLVAAVLAINAALGLWFVYQENRRASIEVQHEKAEAAAQRIESFVREIERQIGWVAQAQWAAAAGRAAALRLCPAACARCRPSPSWCRSTARAASSSRSRG